MSQDTPVCPKCQSKKVEYLASHNSYLCSNKHFFQISKAPEKPLRIFLSYGRDDKAFLALKVKDELRKLGHHVWFDLDRLRPGVDWQYKIEKGIDWVSQAADRARFVLLMTPHSVRRPNGFCLNELTLAIERNINVFPVMVEECEPPLPIRRVQWLDIRQGYYQQDLTDRFQEIFHELVTALEANQQDFEGSLASLRAILDPQPFEVDALHHLKRFVGREWVLEKIDQWLHDPKGEKIFWLTGGPGTGKTALASYLQYNRPVKSLFFCKASSTSDQKGRYEPGDPRLCIRTIAYDLATMIPEYCIRLLQKRDLKEIVDKGSSNEIFEKLIKELLHGVQLPPQENGARAIILIDGLDEVTRDNRNALALSLVSNIGYTPKWVRVIILSRYEPPLISDLQRYTPWKFDQEKARYEHDLRLFIEKEFVFFFDQGKLPSGYVDLIIQKSEGNFLYVETLREALEYKIFDANDIHRFPQGLGQLYHQWLQRRFPKPDDFRRKYFHILAVICAASSPLFREEAEILFDWTEGYEFIEFKEQFGALFKYDNNQIEPFHKSLVDWLTSEEKAGGFYINLDIGHQRLAEHGYKVYQEKKDILNAADQRCLKELPDHLLVVQRERQEALTRLYQLLTDPDIFATYLCENIHGFIFYWNTFCRAYPEKHLSLIDCPNILDKNYEAGLGQRTVTSRDWEICRAIARLYFELGDHKNAGRLYELAAEHLPDQCPEVVKASLYNEIGEAYCHSAEVRDLERSRRYYTEALEIRRRLFVTDHPDLAESVNNLGHVFFYLNDLDKALNYYQEAREMWQRIPGGPYLGEADSWNNIACILENKGDDEEAKHCYQEAVTILGHLDIVHWGIPVIRNNFGNFLSRKGLLDEALEHYREAYEFTIKTYGPEHIKSIRSAHNVADIYFIQGKYEDALSIYSKMITSCENIYGMGHPHTIHLLCMLLESHMRLSKFAEMKAYALKIANCINEHEIEDSEVKLLGLHDLGAAFFYLNDLDTAEGYLTKTMILRESHYPAGHEFIWRTLDFLSETFIKKGDYEKALEYAEKFKTYHLPKVSHEIIKLEFKFKYARCLLLSGKKHEAEQLYFQLITEIESAFPKNLSQAIFNYNSARHEYAFFLRLSDKWNEAEEIYYQIIKDYDFICSHTDPNVIGYDARIYFSSVAYNEIALFSFLPNKQYEKAVEFIGKAKDLMATQENESEYRNMLLNYSIARYREVKENNPKSPELVDINKEIKRVTEEMDRAGDPRAEKGLKLLAEMNHPTKMEDQTRK